jgi:undecaprenyl-diphosphatase
MSPSRTSSSIPTDVPAARRGLARPLALGFVLVAVLGFAALAVLAGTAAYFPVDLTITRALQAVGVPGFAALMEWVSLPGYSPASWLVAGGVVIGLWRVGWRWEAVMALWVAVGASVVENLVKLAVHRPRPSADLVHVARQLASYSFPSGHVVTYTAFVGFLMFLAYTRLAPSGRRTLLLAILGAMIVLVGPSRVFLGGHWASDVLGAYLLGGAWLVGSVALYRRGPPRALERRLGERPPA